MPTVETNAVYIPVRRRHFTTRAVGEANMAGRQQEWNFIENDDYFGVLKSDGSSWRYFSRSKLFEPGNGVLERISVGANEVVINEPGDARDFRVESDTRPNALYVEGLYGNVALNSATIPDWERATYTVLKTGNSAFAPYLYGGDTQGGITWNAYYDQTNARWEYIAADEATMIWSDNRFFAIDTAALGAAANDPITWVENMRCNATATVFNDGSGDVDFRVETDDEEYALFVEGSTDNVGMGTAEPLLNLTGTAAFDLTGHGLHILSDNGQEANFVIEGWPSNGDGGARTFWIDRGGGANDKTISFEMLDTGMAKFRGWDDAGTQVTALDDLLVIDVGNGCIGIGTTTFQAACVRNLALKEGTAPGGATADQGYIWAQDDAGTAEVYVQDGAGNQLKFSPHNKEKEWVFDSKNIVSGRHVYVEMEKFIKDYDKRFGTKFFTETFEKSKKRKVTRKEG